MQRKYDNLLPFSWSACHLSQLDENEVFTVKRMSHRKIIDYVHITLDKDPFPGLEYYDSSSIGEEFSDDSHFESDKSEM